MFVLHAIDTKVIWGVSKFEIYGLNGDILCNVQFELDSFSAGVSLNTSNQDGSKKGDPRDTILGFCHVKWWYVAGLVPDHRLQSRSL